MKTQLFYLDDKGFPVFPVPESGDNPEWVALVKRIEALERQMEQEHTLVQRLLEWLAKDMQAESETANDRL